MSQILKISEAASIGIHAMITIANANGAPVSVKCVANKYNVSEHHTAKVLQRLSKAKLLNTIRGPKGGFILNNDPNDISIFQIYEAIDGIIETTNCFFAGKSCNNCFPQFTQMFNEINNTVHKYLIPLKLSDLTNKPQ
ncbi:MAG: RrF2 family transcriptional regulator [Lentisphaeria bacterium]